MNEKADQTVSENSQSESVSSETEEQLTLSPVDTDQGSGSADNSPNLEREEVESEGVLVTTMEPASGIAPSTQPTHERAAPSPNTAAVSKIEHTQQSTGAIVEGSQLASTPVVIGEGSQAGCLCESPTASTEHSTKDVCSRNRPLLLSLPIDSLHFVASFLTPIEWSRFGQCSKGSKRICTEIFRKVRMHGFRCATEVVTAWKLGQHADAKELCALYIKAGVPIYPSSLGHSYHTLVWRMGIEAKELQGGNSNDAEPVGHAGEGNGETNVQRPVDRFYAERNEARTRDGFSFAMTYLEEKSIYSLTADSDIDDTRHIDSVLRPPGPLTPHRLFIRAQSSIGEHMQQADPALVGRDRRIPLFRFPASASNGWRHRGITKSSSFSESHSRNPKAVIKVHRHLLDQHLLGRSSVDDSDGMMTAPPLSLSVDFFHPHFSLRPASFDQAQLLHPSSRGIPAAIGFLGGEFLPSPTGQATDPQLAPVSNSALIEDSDGAPPAQELAAPRPASNENQAIVATDAEGDGGEVEQPMAGHDVPQESIFEPTNPASSVAPEVLHSSTVSGLSSSLPMQSYPDIISRVNLQVYRASTDGAVPGSVDGGTILRSRFASFERRLENLLFHGDSAGFEECMLDFWDEFFPQTANVHYYDRYTPVPRISSLHKFLTKPCPKAIGIVQCEIERIKLGSKKKGVNMKGRFFPTYEYRLFIRHRPAENEDGSEPPRRDTVLMMGKNRGRKHSDTTDRASGQNAGKKGANNYYLYIPQQRDVYQHYETVNGVETTQKFPPSVACTHSHEKSALLGRLQSNFIGTEFQIFTPQNKPKAMARSLPMSLTSPIGAAAPSSDDDLGYDSAAFSDNSSNSGPRKSRFGRLSLRRAGLNDSFAIRERQTLDDPSRSIMRSRSSGDIVQGRRARRSRRAIANHSDTTETERPSLTRSEEEEGAITYTANLLGSRPRIMDVCIPKVSLDGSSGAEWNTYLNMCTDTDASSGNRMLNHLKRLQQRIENEEHQGGGNQDDEEREIENYSPPDDFGLLALQNRPPWWNIELGSFVLNFGGRVSVASVKNFQLCDKNDQDYIMLQFGRIQGRHSFTMDFQHPLTAVQAFAIAISSLQSKISFG